MANYANLLAQIAANIYSNNNQDITGDGLQLQLNAMVASLGAGYQFMGVAHPADTPSGYADLRAFWLAGEAGTYTNFGGLVLNDGEVAVLKYNGSWSKDVTGAATAAQVDELGQYVSENYKGFSTENDIFNRGVLAIWYDIPTSAAGHELAVLFLGVNPDNNKFYFGIQDLTENKRVGYAISDETYSPIPTSGIQEIYFASFLGRNASYNITNVHIIINWAYFSSATFINGDTSIISLVDWTPQLPSYLISDIDTQSKTSRITNNIIVNNAQMLDAMLCIKDVKVYLSEPLSGGDWSLYMFGYSDQYNRFYFGLRETASSTTFYIYKEYESRPTSGRERLSGFLNTSFMATNGIAYFEIEVDWGIMPNLITINNNDVNFSVFSITELNSITIQEPFNLLNGSLSIPDGVKLIGENSVPIVFATNTMITLGSHCTIENLIFRYQGTGAISSREESGYIFTPIISMDDLATESDSTFFGSHGINNRALYIPTTAQDVHIVGCQFLNFDYCAVYDGGDRHISSAHNSIHDNMFINCRTGLWVTEEFSRIYGNYFFGCLTAIGLNMGDQNIYGNNFIRCDCGIYMNSNQSAHGQIISCHFAHCGVAGVYAKIIGDGLGMIFSGCQFAQAPIVAESSVGLRVDSCRLDTHFIISAGGKNSITNNNIRKTYATSAGITNIFDVPSDTLISGNRSLDLSISDDNYNWSN